MFLTTSPEWHFQKDKTFGDIVRASHISGLDSVKVKFFLHKRLNVSIRSQMLFAFSADAFTRK